MRIDLSPSAGRAEAARRVACARIDRAAESARGRYITPGAGQAMTYLRKEAEARAVLAGGWDGHSPVLAAEAEATGVDVIALAQRVVDQAEAWTLAAGRIEAARLSGKAAIRAAGLDAIDDVAAAAIAALEAI